MLREMFFRVFPGLRVRVNGGRRDTKNQESGMSKTRWHNKIWPIQEKKEPGGAFIS